jgi:hypothetical protein
MMKEDNALSFVFFSVVSFLLIPGLLLTARVARSDADEEIYDLVTARTTP